jgi:hypothetical protein
LKGYFFIGCVATIARLIAELFEASVTLPLIVPVLLSVEFLSQLKLVIV